MAQLLQAGQVVLNITNGNFTLAHLQCASHRRFSDGLGFFITFLGGTDNNGAQVPANSLWCSPGDSLHFKYDHSEPVDIDAQLVDVFLAAMDDPIGVVIAPGGDTHYPWPFKPLEMIRPVPERTADDSK